MKGKTLCMNCGKWYEAEHTSETWGRCPHCGDDTMFSGQLSEEWVAAVIANADHDGNIVMVLSQEDAHLLNVAMQEMITKYKGDAHFKFEQCTMLQQQLKRCPECGCAEEDHEKKIIDGQEHLVCKNCGVCF